MLDLRLEAWPERIEHSEEDRADLLEGLAEDYRKYVGPYHRGADNFDYTEPDPHNYAFNFIAVWLPRLVFGNPQFDVSTTRIGRERQDAIALEYALNRWARQIKLRELAEQLAVDFSFRYAVAVMRFEPQPGFSDYEDPPRWPSPRRIDPADFIYDAQTRDRKRWRYLGYRYRRDLEDVLREAEEEKSERWNLEALRQVPEDGYIEHDYERDFFVDENRKEIDLYDIWVPGVTLKDLKRLGIEHPARDEMGREFTPRNGYNGCWITIGSWQKGRDGAGEWIRHPRMAFCNRTGPITFIGGYFVGNDAMPLSPIQATRAQAEHLNRIARKRMIAVENYKRLALVAADDPIIRDAIKNSKNGDTIPLETIEELSKRFAELEVGGDPHDTLLRYENAALQIFEMSSGMSDAQRGDVTGQGTATENEIAREASATRVGMLALKFREGIADLAYSAAHILWKSEKTPMRLPDGKLFMGGENRGEQLRFARRFFADERIGAGIKLRQIPDEVLDALSKRDEARLADQMEDPFDQLDLAIHPFSMERTPDGIQQMRLQTTMQLVTGLFPLMPQMPYVRWLDFLELIAQSANVPDCPALVNFEVLMEVTKAVAAAMAQGATGGGGGGAAPGGGQTDYRQPRIKIDQGVYAPSGGGGRGGGGTSGGSVGLPGNFSGAQAASTQRQR